MSSRKPRPETRIAQGTGGDPAMNGVVPPIYASAPYLRNAAGEYPGGHSYTRDQNPTFEPAEQALAELEGGVEALLFASGMAAATTVFEALPEGARIVAPNAMYWTLRGWLRDLDVRGRRRVVFVPTGDLAALREAVAAEATDLVWVETPANPMGEVTDLAAAAEIAHAAGAIIAADSTLATPVSTRPLEWGVDLVMHSATKQLNGHADVVAGALVTARVDDVWERVRHERAYRGAIVGPFEAWLLYRGMRTLFVRVRKSAENALQVADALSRNAGVTHVFYAGLPTHPGHAIAAKQMEGGFGPVVSFRTGGGAERAREVAARLRCFADATSLGGVESLVEHRAAVEGPDTLVPDDLLRLSIGIEDADDLVADLEAALTH